MKSNYLSKDIERIAFQAEEEEYGKAPKHETMCSKGSLQNIAGRQ